MTLVTRPSSISDEKAIPDVGFVSDIFQGSRFRIRQGFSLCRRKLCP